MTQKLTLQIVKCPLKKKKSKCLLYHPLSSPLYFGGQSRNAAVGTRGLALRWHTWLHGSLFWWHVLAHAVDAALSGSHMCGCGTGTRSLEMTHYCGTCSHKWHPCLNHAWHRGRYGGANSTSHARQGLSHWVTPGLHSFIPLWVGGGGAELCLTVLRGSPWLCTHKEPLLVPGGGRWGVRMWCGD